MNVVEPVEQSNKPPALEPPQQLEVGSIVTLRMRGHTRTQGLEYFAPAVVLNQHSPNGEIEVLIWDSTAGTHYNPAYPIRDLSSRGEGPERELYVVQSNIGKVLFSPDAFALMNVVTENIMDRLAALEQAFTFPAGVGKPVMDDLANATGSPSDDSADRPKSRNRDRST